MMKAVKRAPMTVPSMRGAYRGKSDLPLICSAMFSVLASVRPGRDQTPHLDSLAIRSCARDGLAGVGPPGSVIGSAS